MRNLDFKWPGSIFAQQLTSIFIWRDSEKDISYKKKRGEDQLCIESN